MLQVKVKIIQNKPKGGKLGKNLAFLFLSLLACSLVQAMDVTQDSSSLAVDQKVAMAQGEILAMVKGLKKDSKNEELYEAFFARREALKTIAEKTNGQTNIDLATAVNFLHQKNEQELIGFIATLIQLGMKVNKEDEHENTALGYAVQYNRPGLVKFLLEQGANANYRHANNENLRSPLLIYAVSRGSISPEIVAMLCQSLKKGNAKFGILPQDPEIITSDHTYSNGNALHIAAAYHDLPVAEILCNMGFNVNAKDADNMTSLGRALRGNYDCYYLSNAPPFKLIELLLKFGADPNQYTGNSAPLSWAANAGPAADAYSLEMLKLFLNAGAVFSVNEHSGESEYCYAKRIGCRPILNLLEPLYHFNALALQITEAADQESYLSLLPDDIFKHIFPFILGQKLNKSMENILKYMKSAVTKIAKEEGVYPVEYGVYSTGDKAYNELYNAYYDIVEGAGPAKFSAEQQNFLRKIWGLQF